MNSGLMIGSILMLLGIASDKLHIPRKQKPPIICQDDRCQNCRKIIEQEKTYNRYEVHVPKGVYCDACWIKRRK